MTERPELSQILSQAVNARAEKAKRSFKYFVKVAWPVIEPGVDFLPNWHIDAIAEHLEALLARQIKRLIVNIPPRCAKSTLASVLFPAWAWLRDPSFRMMTSSYERGLAVRDSIKTRRLIESAIYRSMNVRDYRDLEPIFRMRDKADRILRRLKDSEDWYENSRGGHRIAVSPEGGATGKGGNIFATDDPQNPTQASSDAERIRTLTWWDQTVTTRLDNPKEDVKLIVMQRLHCDDLTGHELSKDLDYVHLKIPMEFDPRKRCVTNLGVGPDGLERVWMDPRTVEGELLWDARFDEKVLKSYRTGLGNYGYAGQMQQEPVPAGGSIFDVAKFLYYDMLPVFDVVVLSVDCAFTDATTSSYVVVQAWGFVGPNAYLIENVRQHLDFVKTEEMIIAVRNRLRAQRMTPSAILVENKANGPAIISRLSKVIPGITPCEPRRMGGSKEARASSVSPFVNSGNVFLPREGSWVPMFLTELANFPRYSSDDQVDALSQGLWWRHLSGVDITRIHHKERFLKWAGMSELQEDQKQ